MFKKLVLRCYQNQTRIVHEKKKRKLQSKILLDIDAKTYNKILANSNQ